VASDGVRGERGDKLSAGYQASAGDHYFCPIILLLGNELQWKFGDRKKLSLIFPLQRGEDGEIMVCCNHTEILTCNRSDHFQVPAPSYFQR
jgi:hypothetical protein